MSHPFAAQANMPFEADTAGSRFKKVLRDALRVFPTKNPAALREAMQNDSSSEEGIEKKVVEQIDRTFSIKSEKSSWPIECMKWMIFPIIWYWKNSGER